MSNDNKKKKPIKPAGTEVSAAKVTKRDSRNFKHGAISTAITVAVVIMIILANVVANIAGDKFPMKLDLTPEQFYEISDETKEFIRKNDKEVEITVMATQEQLSASNIYGVQRAEVVRKYAQESDKIKVNFIDYLANPDYVKKFTDVYKGTIEATDVVVQSGKRVKVLSDADLLNITQSSNGMFNVESSKAEQALNSAIIYVTAANPVQVCMLTPENSVSTLMPLQELLEYNGYDVVIADPNEDMISADNDFVVLAPPLNDLSETVIKRLSEYLYNDGKYGKNLMYLGSFQQNNTPNLNAFLEEWGIGIENKYTCFETSESLKTGVTLAVLQGQSVYASTGVLKDDTFYGELADRSLPIIIPMSMPLTAKFDTNGKRVTSTLIETTPSTVLYPNGDTEFDPNTAEQGTHAVAMIGSDLSGEKPSNVIVFGSAFMFDYYVLNNTAYNNSEYLVNTFNTITGKETGITVLPKKLTNTKLTITESQANGIRVLVIFVIPIIVIAAGIFVWIRRRNR